MTQRSLFPDDRPTVRDLRARATVASKPVTPARATDPDTSHQAAERINRTDLAAKFLSIVTLHQPCTANEAAAGCQLQWGGERESYRKRASELVDSGHLEWGDPRRCNVTDHNARTLVTAPTHGPGRDRAE